MTQLTHGEWRVQTLIGVDEAAGRAFFTANRDDAIEEHVYSVDYRAPGAPQRLTEAGFSNAAVMNKAGSTMIVTRSSPPQTPQIYAAGADGKASRSAGRRVGKEGGSTGRSGWSREQSKKKS